MELFQENGCLTDEALHGLIEERLDEMGRLEVAEHLSFCDRCLERYTAMLTDDTLKTPETPLTPKILSRVRSRVLRLVVNRYAACGAAAVLAFTLWGAGVFDRLVPSDLPVTDGRPPSPSTARSAGRTSAISSPERTTFSAKWTTASTERWHG